MRSVTFPEADVGAIADERYHHPDPRVQRKMEVLWLKHHGLTHERIATLAGLSRSSVQRCLTDYLLGGLEAVRRCSYQGAQSQLDEHRASLEEHFRQHPPRSVQEAQQVIEQRTGLRRGPTQVRRFLRRLGMSPRKAAAIPVPPKSTPQDHAEAQAKFLDGELEPRLEEARAGRRQVYFVDASHFVFATFLGWVWCWARWCVRAASGRKRFNVLGALNAVSHELVRVSNHSYINAASVCALLHAVAAAGTGLPITLVLDNARYQKCAVVRDLAARLGIELLYLPSYSPNLNLIERLWRFVKKECLQSTHYANYEAFTAAITKCLDELPTKHKAAMDTLLTHNFQTFENVSILAVHDESANGVLG
jgi:transposase